MALADSARAIRAVTEVITSTLNQRTGLNASVGRPEPTDGAAKRLNIFLYEASFDGDLRNYTLDDGQPAPAWLVLKYLLTAFDDSGESDTPQAHEYLGGGVRALNNMSFLATSGADPTLTLALEANPETMRLTFDEAPVDLLSKLMQGSDEKYRFSMAFQVRPIMIANPEPPSYSLVVGIDHSVDPAVEIPNHEDAVVVDVNPFLGIPCVDSANPTAFEFGDEVEVVGQRLNADGLFVRIGDDDFDVVEDEGNSDTRILIGIDKTAAVTGGKISAGSHPLSVVYEPSPGQERMSNMLVVGLRPTVSSGEIKDVKHIDETDPTSPFIGTIVLQGELLGSSDDDVIVSLFKDGAVVRAMEQATISAKQKKLTLQMTDEDAVEAGDYMVILRVNGQQAVISPRITI